MDQVKIGKFIAQIRKEQGLTQSQLAEKLNISNKTVSKWETGNGLPDVSLLTPLCELLNVTADEFFMGERASVTLNEVSEKKPKKRIAIIIVAIILIVALCLLATCSFFNKNSGEENSPSPSLTPLLSPKNTAFPLNTVTPDITPTVSAAAQSTPTLVLPEETPVPLTPTPQIVFSTIPIITVYVTPTPTKNVTINPTSTPVITATSTPYVTPTPTVAPTPTPTPIPPATPSPPPTPTETTASSTIPDSAYGGYKFTSKAGRQSQYSYYYINCGMNDSPLAKYSNYTGEITLSYNVYNPTDENIRAQLHVQTNYDNFWCYTSPRNTAITSIAPKTTKTVSVKVPIENGNINFSRSGNIIAINASKTFLRFDVYFNDIEKAGNEVVIFANSSDDPILNCAWYSTNHMTPERV